MPSAPGPGGLAQPFCVETVVAPPLSLPLLERQGGSVPSSPARARRSPYIHCDSCSWRPRAAAPHQTRWRLSPRASLRCCRVPQVCALLLGANLGGEILSFLPFFSPPGPAPSIPIRFPLSPSPAARSGENCSTSNPLPPGPIRDSLGCGAGTAASP